MAVLPWESSDTWLRVSRKEAASARADAAALGQRLAALRSDKGPLREMLCPCAISSFSAPTSGQ